MIDSDISQMTEDERQMLDDAFQSQIEERRMRGVLWSTLAVTVAIFLFTQLGVSVEWFAGIALTLLVISAIEKVSYQRTMKSYESLIRKLVHRIENLEHVPLTPEDARPSMTARKAELVEKSRVA